MSIVIEFPDTNIFSVVNMTHIPLTIPFCEDPRVMHKKRLVHELTKRGVSSKGSKELLAARLLNILCVDEPLVVDYRAMDDLQPEKWWFFCHTAELRVHQLENRKEVLMLVESAIDKVLNEIKSDKDAMIAIALGNRRFESESDFFNVAIQFKSAFSLALAVEGFQVQKHGPTDTIKRSRIVFLWRCGLAKVPDHLTEAGVLNRERDLNKVVKYALSVNGGQTIELGQVIIVDDNGVAVECMVVRWEVDALGGDDTRNESVSSENVFHSSNNKKRKLEAPVREPKYKVVAKPLSAQYGSFEFKLTLEEYLHSVKKSKE